MPQRVSRFSFILFMALLVVVVALPIAAQQLPLRDWAVPSASGGGKLQIGTNTAGNLVPFNKMTPCRVYDSRVAAGGPGPIPGTTSRTIPVVASSCTGIPSNAVSFSLNITVTGSTAGGGYAFVTAYAAGATRPGVSTVNFLTGAQVANAAIVPAGTGGAIAIYASAATDVIVDINGYFADTPDANYQLYINGNEAGFAAIFGGNSSATAGSHGVGGFEGAAGVVHGVQGQVGSATLSNSSGVHGINDSAAASAFGALGEVTPAAAGSFSSAVRGYHHGTGGGGIGGWFSHAGGGWGAYVTSVGGYGAYVVQSGTPQFGQLPTILASNAAQATTRAYAIEGVSNATLSDSAGVLGIDASGQPAWWPNSRIPAGVLGLSKSNIGVFGESEWVGVDGLRMNADGTGSVEGTLAWGAYGVYSSGNFAATGTKAFVEPHPTEAGQVIRYVALEGPEAGTYFRGRGRFVNHHAVISVPDTFRMVTDEDGITVNVTPMGGVASVGVMSVNLNQIEVESSKDVEFSYLVQGVRRTFKDFVVMGPGEEYMPKGPNASFPPGINAEQKRLLIQNGTYNADGTVNMETAERLGWAQKWRDRAAEQQKRSEEVARQMATQQQSQQQ